MLYIPLMNPFIDVRDATPERSKKCTDGKEHHFTEAAVMIAFALHLLDGGVQSVELHPDGEHAKRHNLKATLETLGFQHSSTRGSTNYGGVYSRNGQRVAVNPKSGSGDVVARVGSTTLVAECKGGVMNSSHAGQVSRLRRGLCEAVGLLMARPLTGERHVAVIPETAVTRRMALRMLPRASAANIEIALVNEDGTVEFLPPESVDEGH